MTDVELIYYLIYYIIPHFEVGNQEKCDDFEKIPRKCAKPLTNEQ